MSAVGSILTNSGALTALNSIAQTSQTTDTLQNELASGLSISSPSDNPAGYITAQGFTSQINGLTQATSNANQGVSLLQTAQSAIGQQISVVQQLNSIAVQAANSTQTPAEAQSLQNVVGQLTDQVTTIANQTQFNNINLLDGSYKNMQFQVGANEGQTIDVSIGSTAANQLGMYSSGSSAATTIAATGTSQAISLGAVTIDGVTAGSSAAAIAKAINVETGTTGVEAQAASTNSASYAYSATANTAGGTLKLASSASGSNGGYGKGTSVTLTSGDSLSTIVSNINSALKGGTSGITASSANGALVLKQANGKNIEFGSALTTTSGFAAVAKNSVQRAGVELMSSSGFTVTGLDGTTTQKSAGPQTLADINVGTVSGANQAINVIKYALQGLNNQDGGLGAVQQRFTATIANLSSTSTNATTALGVVQDANIPAVANQLTQAQIQAQSGVAALKSSTELQQTYLSLLP